MKFLERSIRSHGSIVQRKRSSTEVLVHKITGASHTEYKHRRLEYMHRRGSGERRDGGRKRADMRIIEDTQL